jgi:hypothetical protein
MEQSAVAICNKALTKIGNTAHFDDFEDPTEEARVAKSVYEQSRDLVLESADWPFATRRASPPPLANFVRTNWAYGFNLPVDFLKLQEIIVEGSVLPIPEIRAEYQIEANDAGTGRVLLTNLDVIEIKYTARIENVAAYSAHFVRALVLLLASEFAAGLKKDANLALSLEKQYDVRVTEASAFEKNQREIQKLEPTTPSLRARGGNGLSSTE